MIIKRGYFGLEKQKFYKTEYLEGFYISNQPSKADPTLTF
jgi:DNA-binding transcriptional regulator YhcF (GntR family)